MKAVYKLNVFDFARLIKTIRYGYMDADGKLHFADEPDFYVYQYVFSSPEQIIQNNCGWCWDVANLIVEYCKKQGLNYRYFFMEYFTEKLHQTHTQVFVALNGQWCAFPDNSSPDSLGEKMFERMEDCVDDFLGQFEVYLKHVLKERYDKDMLLLKEITEEIPAGISDEEYLALARGKQ